MEMPEQSFMKALFSGVIAEDVIFPFPQIAPAERDRVHDLIGKIRSLASTELDAARTDREARLDSAVLDRARALGLFGLAIPVEYGGAGLSSGAYARVLQEIAGADASLALVLHTHQALVARALLTFGDDRQKAEFLPRLARGELIAGFALTEHAAGTDAGSIRTVAEIDEKGEAYLLNGEKPWVTSAAIANLFIVFARTNRYAEGNKPHLVALIVERGPGVEVGEPHDLLGVRGSGVAPLILKDAVVPVDRALGEVGKGFKVAMAALNDARIALSASTVGQSRELVTMTIKRLTKRRSFGRVVGEFSILKDKVAKMVADSYAIESMVYVTTGLVDRGVEDYSLESAICRVACSEALWRVANEAMQAAAGIGYFKSHPIERILRDARASFIVDGTNETLRCFIALAGMRGPGVRMSEVQRAMYEPIKGFGLLRDFAVRKVREALRRERLTRAHPLLDRETVIFEEAVDELARAVDRELREHGTEIAEMQQIQLRIANVAIDLYALAACMARTTAMIEEHGEAGARRHIDLTIMFAGAARARIKSHLERLEHNDDELRKLIAARTYTDGGYPFDVV